MTHYGRGYCNAFWNGAHLVFGAGDAGMSVSPLFMSFAQLDIATHEFSHAVIDHLSPLTYSHQSGALNESVCDVFTVMLGHYRGRHASHQGTGISAEHCLINKAELKHCVPFHHRKCL